MDIQRKGAGKRKLVRWIVTIVVLVVAIGGITFGLGKLKPAAPGVEMSTLWPDQVKRGPMLREVRGLGTLVPVDTMLITATTDGRVGRILIRPGTQVRADSVVMEMSSPELQTLLLSAEFALKAAQADYENLKVTLEKSLLDMQANAAQVEADYNTAKLQADRDLALAKENLLPNVDAQISDVKAKESRKISLNDEVHPFHLVVFGKAYKKLDSTDDYELAVSYSREVDPFLKQISDLKGARSLLLYRVDVTDAGLEAIPTMPDLAKVSITPNGGGHLTAAGIAELREQRPELSVELHPEEFVHDPSGARSND